MITAQVYFYDAVKKEMTAWSEGTPLRNVVTLRTKSAGVAYGFSQDGYVVGLLTDNGQFQVIPLDARPIHISEFGGRVKISSKPRMLDDLPEPNTVDSLTLPLFCDGRYIITVTIRLLDAVMGRTVSIARKWRVNFDLDHWRRLAKVEEDLDIGDGRPVGLPGKRMMIRSKDLVSMIFGFARHEGGAV